MGTTEIMLQSIGYGHRPLAEEREKGNTGNKKGHPHTCLPLVDALDTHIWQNGTKTEAKKVASLVRGYMDAIIEDLHCLGRYSKGLRLIECGSFYEGLRVGLPYEFDFMLEIQETVEFPSLNQQLKTVIQSNVQERLISDLQQCFRRRQEHKELKLREFRDCYNCPNFWFYMEYKQKGVMIDLVPCLKLPRSKLPFAYDEDDVRFIRDVIPEWVDTTSCISDALYLVPTEIHKHWRLSTSEVELKVMQNLPDAAKCYLRILKYLCNRNLLHTQSYDSRRISKAEIMKLYGYKGFLPSYVLKLMFLKHMRNVYVNELPLHQGMYSADSLGILQSLLKQLRQFKVSYIANPSSGTIHADSFLFGSKHKIVFRCFDKLDESKMCQNIEWFDRMINGMELFLDDHWWDEDMSGKVSKLNLLNFPKDKGVTFPFTASKLSSKTSPL